MFHLIEIERNKTYESVYPILLDSKLTGGNRLHVFTRRFFEQECKDRHLKTAMLQGGFTVGESEELARGHTVFVRFVR